MSEVKRYIQHRLKILPQFYCRVADGSKTFEVRNNDRGFQPGDEVFLYEWDNVRGVLFCSPTLHRKIGYVLPIDAERVVFSLLPVEVKFFSLLPVEVKEDEK